MPGVPDVVAAGPWWWLFGFLTCVVFIRTQATYWLARWARAGADAVADRAEAHHSRRARLARRFAGPGLDKARTFIERWGFIAIPLSFLTVGFQTMVNAAAGYARMRWDLYSLVLIPCSLLWATIYTLVFLGLWDTWQRSPWLLAALVAVVIAVGAGVTGWRRRRASKVA